MPVDRGPDRVPCRPTSASAHALACRAKFALKAALTLGGLWVVAGLAPLATPTAYAGADGTGRLELRPELSDTTPPADCPAFTDRTVNVEVRKVRGGKNDGQRALFGEVKATTRSDCGTPVVGSIKVAPQPGTGEFRFKIPLRGPRTRASFLLVDIRGIPRKVTLDVVFPDYANLLKGKSKQGTFTVGLGFTKFQYIEDGLNSYEATALTPKVSVDYPILPGKLSIGGNLFGNALILSSNTGSGYSVRFFGGNIRASYTPPRFLPPRWRLSFSTGVYMVTSSSRVTPGCTPPVPCLPPGTENFGFANLMGPQLYPALSYLLPNDHSIETYFKYSPVSSGFSFLGGSREIAYGLSYMIPKRTRDGIKPGWSFSVDHSDLVLLIDGMKGTLGSKTFSINYAF